MIALLLAALLILAAPPALAQSGPRVTYLQDRLMVCLKPAAAARARTQAGMVRTFKRPFAQLGVTAVDRAASRYGAAIFEPEFAGETAPDPGSDETDFTAFWIVRWPHPVPVDALAAELSRLPDVEIAQPIASLPVSVQPNDPFFASSTWFYDPLARADIHATEAWDVTTGDTSIVIAILDTGVLMSHPDLAGQIWTNWAEAGGTPGVDDDVDAAHPAGNGYVDDVHGWDFVNRPPDNVTPGEDYDVPDNDPSDFAGHGTMVAGVAGAATNNGTGVSGVVWNARIMPLRVGLSFVGDPLGRVFMDHAAEAIRYATRMKASVINCSFESINQFDVGKAARAAIKAGITFVVSSGNSQLSEDYLMTIPGVIAVTATGPGDAVVIEANRDPLVDLAAPGVDITSTISHFGVAAYDTLSGTSFSAPMVAGAAALVQARQKTLGLPPLIPEQMLLRLYETADDVSALNPGVLGYGAGRLNVARALTDRPTSTAMPLPATTVGAALRLPPAGADERIAYVTNNRRLLVMRGQSADTLAVSTLPAFPYGSLAGADFDTGFLMFVGLTNGRLHGMLVNGSPIPTWPVDVTGGLARVTGTALGDLDGDGLLEIVALAENGFVHVLHPDGNTVDPFPIELDPTGTTSLPALADLDGDGAMEIVVTTASGFVHVLGVDGSERPGWPQAVPMLPRSPAIGRLTTKGAPAIVVAAQDSVIGFLGDGTRTLGIKVDGTVFNDPVLGDLDADGAAEIVLANSMPELLALDSTGVAKPGWPRALTGFPTGEAAIGSLAADVATPSLEALIHLNNGLRGFRADGTALAAFPKPVTAGINPSILELDNDGASEILAGTDLDSVLYVFDAGAGTATSLSPPGRDWPTLRANYARTGSLDVTPPSPVTTLSADTATTETSVLLHWLSPPNEGLGLKTVTYLLRASESPIDSAGFDAAPFSIIARTNATAGDPRNLVFGGLRPGRTYHFAMKTEDLAGNASKISNPVTANTRAGTITPQGQPFLAASPHPSPSPVSIHWRGEGTPIAGQRLELYDLSGARMRGFNLPVAAEGVVVWNGTRDDGSTARSGVYFARLWTGARHVNARIVLVR